MAARTAPSLTHTARAPLIRAMNRRASAALFILALSACRPSGEASPGPASASASQGAPHVAPTPTPTPAPAASATSEPAPDTSQYALVVHVGASAITAGGAPVLALGPRDELAQRGADARYKKSQNPNELFLVPLGEVAVSAARAPSSTT
jgi:hypothetical protein